MSFQSPFCQLTKGCTNYREGKLLGCASCNLMERQKEKAKFRASLKQKKAPVRSGKKIKPRSDKRIEEDKVYKVLRQEQLTEHPECQIKIMDICEKVATEVHHTGSRGQNYLKKETFVSGCGPCHRYLHNKMSAIDRRDKGLLI